ncbi:hypothetical protein [Kitasatospora purpeofusca]
MHAINRRASAAEGVDTTHTRTTPDTAAHAPARRFPVVDVIGAGDAFVAG